MINSYSKFHYLCFNHKILKLNRLSDTYILAVEASIKASIEIMQFYEDGFKSNLKEDGSPVTEADFAASKVISSILEKTNIPILGEETVHQDYEERQKWTLNWCVDPLDGTKEFIKRNGQFAVNIALIENQKSIFGVIASPTERIVLFGGENTGVYISSFETIHNHENWIKLNSQNTPNTPLILCVSHSSFSEKTVELIEKLKQNYSEINLLKKGSALKFFDLVLGKADIYPRYAPTMEWDIAAGQAILEALGGSVISVETGESLIYNKENLLNPNFIALTKPLIKLFS